MPRNKKRDRQRFRAVPPFDASKFSPGSSRNTVRESSTSCRMCNRTVKYYPNNTEQLCQFCKGYDETLQNGYAYPNPAYISYPFLGVNINPVENLSTSNFLINDNFVGQERTANVDTWQRRIYMKDAPKTSANFKTYGHNSLHPHQMQRPYSYRSQEGGQAFLSSNRVPNANYPLSNNASSSSTCPPQDLKRKREPENLPMKRIKNTSYESDLDICQFNQLTKNMMEYFHEYIQTDANYTSKMALRSRLQNIIEKRFSGCDVFVFGSSMTGFATRMSDADMSLMFHDAKIVKNRVVRILWDLRNLFSRHHCFTKMQVIRAKVPIIKFRDSLSGFEVDLNINNPTGIRNSQLLRSYARLDKRVQPLVLGVKFWAREHNINDAKMGTLSSYSLGLMLIHYLQCGCFPPVLPSLQVLQPDKYSPNADIRFVKIDEELPNFQSENDLSVGQLFVGFLRYYSREFDYENQRISVRLGRLLPRVDKQLQVDKTLRHWIDIEEPFEQTNTTRSVHTAKNAAYIKSVFDNSYNSIIEKGTLGHI